MNIVHILKSFCSDLRVRIITLRERRAHGVIANLATVIDDILIDLHQYKARRRRKALRANLGPTICAPSNPPNQTRYQFKGAWECEVCAADNEISLDKFAACLGSIRRALKPTCWNCGATCQNILSASSPDIDVALLTYWMSKPTSYFWGDFEDLEYLDFPILAVLGALKPSLEQDDICGEKRCHLIDTVLAHVEMGPLEGQECILYQWIKENHTVWNTETHDPYHRRVAEDLLKTYGARQPPKNV